MRLPPEAARYVPSRHAPDVAARLRGALTCGLLLALSFPPFPFPILGSFALLPLLRLWYYQTDMRLMYLDSFFALLVTFLIAFSWPLLHRLPDAAWASLSGFFLLPMMLALPFALAIPLRRQFGIALGCTALVAFSVAIEWVISHGPFAMPGPLLGNTLAAAPSLNQIADLAGVPGLTVWLWLCNLCFFFAITGVYQRRRLAAGITVAILFAAAYTYGLYRTSGTFGVDGTIDVGLVQPAVSPEQWAGDDKTPQVDALFALSDSLLDTPSAPHILIWPETAVSVLPSAASSRPIRERLTEWITRRGITLLTGAIAEAPGHMPSVSYANSALLLRPNFPLLRYDKNKLVPFAERVPFESVLPHLDFLRVQAGGVAGYQPGRERVMLPVGPLQAGPLICFESLFGDYTRRYVKAGADFLAVLSQTGWWGRSLGPWQYLAFTRLRAIETRRAVVIATVAGPSALILPSGQVQIGTEWMKRRALTVKVPVATERTFYVTHGDWVSIVGMAVALLLTGWFFVNRFSERWMHA
ncbi:MAG: apolipoprotein N-acyltransferase [Rhodothermales bacterium]